MEPGGCAWVGVGRHQDGPYGGTNARANHCRGRPGGGPRKRSIADLDRYTDYL